MKELKHSQEKLSHGHYVYPKSNMDCLWIVCEIQYEKHATWCLRCEANSVVLSVQRQERW
jgi:hypothetical protein